MIVIRKKILLFATLVILLSSTIIIFANPVHSSANVINLCEAEGEPVPCNDGPGKNQEN